MSPHTVSGKQILLLQTVVITKCVRGPPSYRFSVAVSLDCAQQRSGCWGVCPFSILAHFILVILNMHM